MLWNICMLFGLGDEESPRLPVDIPSHTRPAIPGGLRSRIARFRFVRPAGRVHSEVKVLYRPDRRNC